MLKFASVLVALLVIENASAASFFQSISFGSCVDSPVISDFNKAKVILFIRPQTTHSIYGSMF